MVEVIATDDFVAWYRGLEENDRLSVTRVVDLLEVKGVSLGYPHSSALKGTVMALRELRVQAKPLRVIYAFDPERQAVLLIGGDKTGDERFYETIIPQAEKIWVAYLKEQSEKAE